MRGSSRGVLRVDDLGLLVEDVDDPVERRRGGEERVVELRQLLHGVEEVREVEREGEERPGREAAVEDEPAAESEDDRGRDRREHVDGREVEPVEDDGLVVRRAVGVVDAAKARLARRLARERLHDAHPGDVLRQRRGDQAEALPHTPVGSVRAHAEPRGRGGHERQHDERGERQPPVEEEQHDGGAEEDERVLDEAREAVGDELVERLDVVRDAADDGAGAVALEEAEREPLQVAEEPDPEIREPALADPAGEVRLQSREGEGARAPPPRRRRRPRRSARTSPAAMPSSIATLPRYGGIRATSV